MLSSLLFLLFILHTGSYNIAQAGLEPHQLLFHLLNFEASNTSHSRRDRILSFLLQVGD